MVEYIYVDDIFVTVHFYGFVLFLFYFLYLKENKLCY